MTHDADEKQGPHPGRLEAYLSVSNVHKSYHNAENGITVLDGITFSASEGETVGIVGPNGCGKSTLLLSIAGLQGIDEGEISIRGSAPGAVSVGLVFQDYRESLLPWRTVGDNIAFPLELKGMTKRERRAKVIDFLKQLKVKLPYDRYPYELSGGQQQTVSILRSLIQAPRVLLLDEPFGSLDYRARLNMHERIQSIFAQTKQTAILVSHEIDEAILLSDRVLVMSNRPARMVADVPVKLPKPRRRNDVLSEDFLEIKRTVFGRFPLDVRA